MKEVEQLPRRTKSASARFKPLLGAIRSGSSRHTVKHSFPDPIKIDRPATLTPGGVLQTVLRETFVTHGAQLD